MSTYDRVMDAYVSKKEKPNRSAHGRMFFENGTLYSYGYHFPLAVRTKCRGNELFVLNGDQYSSTTSRHQRICQSKLRPSVTISRSAFRSAIRNVFNELENGYAEVLDWEPDCSEDGDGPPPKGEYLSSDGWTVRYWEAADHWYAHRAGRCLIRHRTTEADSWNYYVCGMDEGSYFVCELPASAETVQDAFKLLRPEPIRDRSPSDWLRQGEFFFVPAPGIRTKDLKPVLVPNPVWVGQDPPPGAKRQVVPVLDQILPGGDSQQGGNYHQVREVRVGPDGTYYVRGKVFHRNHYTGRSTREHRAFMLQDWHAVYRNTALRSWSANGRVD